MTVFPSGVIAIAPIDYDLSMTGMVYRSVTHDAFIAKPPQRTSFIARIWHALRRRL